MGYPMKGKFLSVAIALSMLAVVFVAVPSQAAVYYTGSVYTTDDAGNPVDTYFRGEHVYVAVELFYEGEPADDWIELQLQTQTGVVRDWFSAVADDPENGTYHSWSATPVEWLNTGSAFDGDLTVYDVVVYAGGEEVARTPIVVLDEGLTLEPDPWFAVYYYPGEEITITLTTSETADFYVQIVNDTYETFANWTNLEVADGYWSTVWTIDHDMPDGAYWVRVRAELDNSEWYSTWFNVVKYELIINCNRDYVLPGETVTVIYDVVEIETLSHYDDATIEWTALWLDEDGNETYDTGVLPDPYGEYLFTMPTDIVWYSDIMMYFWANDTDDRSEVAWLFFELATLTADLSLDDSSYMPGDTVSVQVSAMVGWDDVPGAEVDIKVEKNGTTIVGYGVNNLMTDVTGTVTYEFDLSLGAAKGTYVVTATISKLDYDTVRMATFEVDWGGELIVTFARDYYYSGQVASFDMTTIWNNEEIATAGVYYTVTDDSGMMVASDNTTSGFGYYQIPGDYVGGLEVSAVTIVNGYFLQGWDDIDVYLADVVISPQDEEYRAGDTLVFYYEVVAEIDNASLSYDVVDRNGLRVASGNLPYAASGMFEYVVPSTNPSTRYTGTITLDDMHGHIVSSSVNVWLVAEYEIRVWLASGSKYDSGAFEPGNQLTFNYEVVSSVSDHLDVYQIEFYSSVDYIYHNMFVTDPEGTFRYSVSDDADDGSYYLGASLIDPVTGDYLSYDGAAFDILADQSSWDRSVGGLSLFEMTVLLMLAVMIILLIVVPYIKGRTAVPKPAEPRLIDEPEPPTPPS
jgi:hypothetical protein